MGRLSAAVMLALVCAACGTRPTAQGPAMKAFMLRPDIISRQAWDQGLPSGSFTRQTPSAIVIVDEGEIALRITNPPRYLNYVRENQRGRDIPYHYYIDRKGHVYEGRMPQVEADPGAGRGRSGEVYVSLLDDTDSREPTKESLTSLARLCAWLCASFQIEPETDLHTQRSLGRGDRPGVFLEIHFQEGNLLAAVRKLHPKAPVEPEF